MAAALEFYKNSTTTQVAHTGDYQTYLACAVNRTGKPGAKNFIVIAHVGTDTWLAARGKVRLRQDGSVNLGELADGLITSGDAPEGYTHNFVKRVNLDASSHTFTLDLGRISGAGNYFGENASIVVLEESVNAQYNDSVATVGTGAETGWVDYLSLQFTAAASGKHLLVWSCETMCEDESDPGVAGIQFSETQQALGVYASEGIGELVMTGNDNFYRSVAGACFADLVGSTQYTFKIQMQGDGAADEVYCRKGAIIAIPFSDFENVYFDSQAAKTFHTTAQSDTNVVLASQACNAADHLIIAGVEVSCESANDAGFSHLISAGPTDFVAPNFADRDEDYDEFYLSFLVHGVTLAADSYDLEIEGDSISDQNEGCVRKAYLIVCEIPAGEVYVPNKLMMVH